MTPFMLWTIILALRRWCTFWDQYHVQGVNKLPVKHGGLGVLSASDLALLMAVLSVFISKTIIIDATWWHQWRQLQILYGHMAVDHQDTNIRFVDRCQSENMMSKKCELSTKLQNRNVQLPNLKKTRVILKRMNMFILLKMTRVFHASMTRR